MADFNSSLPVRTENDGDVVVKVADSAIPSQQLTVNADGSVNITDNGGSLTVDGVDFDIRDLDASQDNVAISDGTDTLAVNADGSINITDNGGSLTVDATDLDIRDLSSAQDSVEVLQDTHDDLNANANIQVGDVDVSNGNPVPVSDAGGSLTVDATDLDIRDLSAAQDNVAISDGTDTLEVNADGSINITDNGGSLTVDATDLDIRDLDATQDNVAISDGTNTLAVNADGSINVVPQEDPGTKVVDYDTTAAVAGGASDNHDRAFTNAARLYQVWASASGKLKIEVQVETGAATNTFNTILVGFNSTSNPNIEADLSKYAAVPAGARVRVIRTNRDNQAQDVYSTIVAIES